MMRFDKFKEGVRKRNLEIGEQSRHGEKHSQIAKRYNLSRSGISFIIQEFEDNQEGQKRCDELLASIQPADDLNRSWAVEDLVEMIALLPVTRSHLKKHFLKLGVTELSLEDVTRNLWGVENELAIKKPENVLQRYPSEGVDSTPISRRR